MADAPRVSWHYIGSSMEDKKITDVPKNTAESTWDAGTVDAGSDSTQGTQGKQYYTLWNNYTQGSAFTKCSDMTEAKISVKDGAGETVKGRVSNQLQEKVHVMFYAKHYNTGVAGWYCFDPNADVDAGEDAYIKCGDKASSDAYKLGPALKETSPVYILPYDATAIDYVGVLKGDVANTGGQAGIDTDGGRCSSRMQLTLEVNSDADAGNINWIVRVSYKYT